jgi:pantothenate synthetase
LKHFFKHDFFKHDLLLWCDFFVFSELFCKQRATVVKQVERLRAQVVADVLAEAEAASAQNQAERKRLATECRQVEDEERSRRVEIIDSELKQVLDSERQERLPMLPFVRPFIHRVPDSIAYWTWV